MAETIAPPAAPSAPSAPVAPPPAPAEAAALVTQAPPAEDPNAFGDPFADIAALGREEGTPPPVPEKKPDSNGKPRGDDGKFKEQPKPAAETKPQQQNGNKPPEKAAELRRLKDQYETENKTLKAELEKLRTAKPPEDPEKKTLSANLAAREKRVAELEAKHKELEQELTFSAFEKSSEYKEKYEAPFVDAWGAGAKLMTEFTVAKKVNEDGEVIREERPANAKDFEDLMSISKAGDAAKFINDLFGNDSGAGELLAERRRIILLNQSREKAIQEHRKTGEQREATRMEEWKQGEEARAKHFDTMRDSGVEKYPRLFKDDPNDPKGNELLAKGRHWADRAFSQGQPLKEGDKPLSPGELTALQAAAWNKMAGFDRMVYQNNSLRKENAELKAKLDGFEKSKPGMDTGDGKGRATVPGDATLTADARFKSRFGT